ncbi:MAG: hypothetical protein KDE45_09425 [Caldilineaceae bacterium]|nr:hypothetical protein [Caldilineaceae bacterium]
MNKPRATLPDDFLQWPDAKQRRYLVELDAKRYMESETGHPDAWYDLLKRAVTADPDIPEPAKVKLRASLIRMMNGSGSIDPYSPERRAKEKHDADIYSAMLHVGGGLAAALKAVAEDHGVSVSTIRRAYERHIKRWPQCQRLDARRKGKRGRAGYNRG